MLQHILHNTKHQHSRIHAFRKGEPNLLALKEDPGPIM